MGEREAGRGGEGRERSRERLGVVRVPCSVTSVVRIQGVNDVEWGHQHDYTAYTRSLQKGAEMAS